MRKYGKFERMPDGTRAKQPKVKNVLLQTYFTSLLCMVLCVSMFFGTSYAWFTSEVNNVGNEIYIGTLKAGLDKNVGTDGWKSLSDKINGVNVTNLFDKNIRWEPGYTSLETIRVTNQGDLAFKYTLYFTDGQIANDTQSDLAAVAGNFDVWIFDHHANKEKTEAVSNPASYDQITEANGWTPIGTLADVLNGKAVLENKVMETVRKHDSNTDADTPNSTDDGVMTVDTYIIALHMKEAASDNSLMGKKIVLNVKLVAYQMGHEKDSFGNSAYDDAKFVTTAKELQAALDNATNNTVIRFANDITGDVTVTQKENVKITIDGDAHNFKGIITVDGKSERYETAALTIQNTKFSGVTCPDSNVYPDAYIRLAHVDAARYTDNVTVRNCTFSGTDNNMVAVKSYKGGDWNLTIDGCTVEAGMHSLAQLKNVEKNLIVTNCKVYSKNGINLNSTPSLEMSGCTFDVKGYAARFGVKDTSVIGQFKIADSNLKTNCTKDSGDAVIIFRGTMTGSTLELESTTVTATNTEVPQIINDSGATVTGLN